MGGLWLRAPCGRRVSYQSSQPATVRSLLEPYADRMVISARAAHHQGSVAYFLARLAAAVGDHRAADEGSNLGSSATNGATQTSSSQHAAARTGRSNCSNAPMQERRPAASNGHSRGSLGRAGEICNSSATVARRNGVACRAHP